MDGCYSWSVGSAIATVSGERGRASLQDREGMLRYALRMEQNARTGGLRDKPDMNADLYHTMYCLCGLSLLGGVLEVGPLRGTQGTERGR